MVGVQAPPGAMFLKSSPRRTADVPVPTFRSAPLHARDLKFEVYHAKVTQQASGWRPRGEDNR